MEALYATSKPLDIFALWKIVSSDLNQITDLATIMSGLAHAEKIQQVKEGGGGWLPRIKVATHKEELINNKLRKEL